MAKVLVAKRRLRSQIDTKLEKTWQSEQPKRSYLRNHVVQEVSLRTLFSMTKGTNHSRPIPRHHLQGITSVVRGDIRKYGDPFAMLDVHEDGTARITIAPGVKSTRFVELAMRHEIGHNVWRRFVPEYFKKSWRSEERFAKAYSEVFRRSSKERPARLKELWPPISRGRRKRGDLGRPFHVAER